ncbi:hypothetical protein [Desulfovibrio sp. JC022]|uniref:hypothetical protein n=1 Tax=Desulfovibrio sp. JC022 TaxID=2593642 RepID=UPI0013D481D0|nr:hypothetical protein [Desulfovibrio sp. JC022]NDV24857.1 hypothetical protein [Desulfovibrio sp. JC022]
MTSVANKNEFYNSLSPTGKRIIAALIQSAPTMEREFPFVLSSLQHTAGCSKLSVLRTIPKGERAGLFERKSHEAGRRHGSILTLNKERCERFLKLHTEEYGQSPVTKDERYQEHGVTNADRYPDTIGNSHDRKDRDAFQSLNLEDNADLLFSRLSDQGKRVFGIISGLADHAENDEIPLVIQSVAREAFCSEVTARRVIKQGHENGFYTKSLHERGPRFGIILKLNAKPMKRMKELLQAFPVQADTENACKADRYQSGVIKHDRYIDRNDTDLDTKRDRYPFSAIADHVKQAVTPCNSRADSNSESQSETNGDRYQDLLLLDRQKRNLSGFKENELWARRLLSLSADDFEILWPRLHAEKFGPNQIRQIVQHRLPVDESVADIENSLHAVEWELEHDTFPEAHKGPCNYLFATLKSKGTWRKPVGFQTPNEQILANMEKEKTVIRKIEKLEKQQTKEAKLAGQDEKFEKWLAAQTPEELTQIDGRCCPTPPKTDQSKRTWRKFYWNKNINRKAA